MPALRSLLFTVLASCAFAQDLHVTSPDGRIDFQLGVILPPAPGSFLRLRYQVAFNAKPLLDVSYLGFLIHNQEPMLGENLGLSASRNGHGDRYNWLIGEFLQNGSLGRRINVEVRAYSEGVALRYLLPRTSPLEDLVIESEETEFSFAQDVKLPESAEPPLRVEQPGVGWVSLGEVPSARYPKMRLDRSDPKTMRVFLPASKGRYPVESITPFTTPWRVIAIASSADQLDLSRLAEDLK